MKMDQKRFVIVLQTTPLNVLQVTTRFLQGDHSRRKEFQRLGSFNVFLSFLILFPFLDFLDQL